MYDRTLFNAKVIYYLKDILFPRMAITLWSTKTPGAAQLERDIAVMNNKKKVSLEIAIY